VAVADRTFHLQQAMLGTLCFCELWILPTALAWHELHLPSRGHSTPLNHAPDGPNSRRSAVAQYVIGRNGRRATNRYHRVYIRIGLAVGMPEVSAHSSHEAHVETQVAEGGVGGQDDGGVGGEVVLHELIGGLLELEADRCGSRGG